MHRQQKDRPLIIKGDQEARYDLVRDLFRDCQTVGFPGAALEVGKPAGEET
jgi:biopolymer transport protein ExbD